MLHRWWYGFGAAAVVAGDRGYVLLQLLSSCIGTYLDVGFTVWFAVLTTVWRLTGETCAADDEEDYKGQLLAACPFLLSLCCLVPELGVGGVLTGF